MAKINISFNGIQKDLDDFCNSRKYQDLVLGGTPTDFSDEMIPNPESKTDFFIRSVREWVWESVRSERVKAAGDSARQIEINKVISF